MRKPYKLQELLDQVTPDNIHEEVSTGSLRGREINDDKVLKEEQS